MITIGFSSHRTEVIPYVRRQMEQHQIIVLEEAPSPEFLDMLDQRVSIDEYMMSLDSGFPEFERQMCVLLQELHNKGRQIVQVEPYLETLLQIHELLSDGKTPEDVVKDPRLESVYEAEKHATGALINYYADSLKAPFDKVVKAVKDFAQADAARLMMRERLRARAIKPLVSNGVDVYVEAGYIHYPLYHYLKKTVGSTQRIRIVYLLAPVVRRLQGRRRNMGPGDILTLHYALHGGLPEDQANLLAARSLIYIKLLQKDELLPGYSDSPHSEDEARVNRIVDSLSLDDCRSLFNRIRLVKREGALQVVQAYLSGSANYKLYMKSGSAFGQTFSKEGEMPDKEKFLKFFEEVGIKSTHIHPEDVVIEMDEDVPWEFALSVGQLWFLFGKDDGYLGLLNDETMQFEPREK